jgi:hypothetical protein
MTTQKTKASSTLKKMLTTTATRMHQPVEADGEQCTVT